MATERPRGLSKSVISRVIIGLTPFRVLITLLITYLPSPPSLQVSPTPQEHVVQAELVQRLLPPPEIRV